MNDKTQLIKEFIEAFEEVFDNDWEYTKEMLGMPNQVPQQKMSDQTMGLESGGRIIASNGTFVNPRVRDEIEDWGNRGKLLRLYRELKNTL